MPSEKPLINKVAQKALVTIDLESFFPAAQDIAVIDLKDYLFRGLLLREADFRAQVQQTDWSAYRDKYVAVFCSNDAIIPVWAYMVLAAELSPFVRDVAGAAPGNADEVFLYRNIAALDLQQFEGKRVVIKGCGDRPVPQAAYVQLTARLAPVARAVMYGEPCSTVPVYKKSADGPDAKQ